jgi:hypothetical protein
LNRPALPPEHGKLVNAYGAAFLRIAVEKAAMDGDENAVSVLPTLPQPDDELRRKAEAAVEEGAGALPLTVG